MKKKLDEAGVMNELRGSLFFQPPQTQKATKARQRKSGSQSPTLPTSQEVKRLRGREVRRSASQEARRPEDTPTVSADWDDDMTWKGSHLYTERERNLFDEIVLQLREKHGIEVQKRLLARAAIRLLSDDLKRHGDKSFVVSLLTGQIKNWLEPLASQEARRPGGQPAKKPAS